MSPEFLRHAWLELTPYRLVAMPVVLIGVFLVALLFAGGNWGSDLAIAAVVVFAGIVFPWGNRMIADSLTQEIAGNTWDRQRMSALGAWEMTWGKLFGLLDVSSGFDEFGKRCCDQVNDSDEGRGFSIASGSCAGGFEDPVQAFETRVGVGRSPALKNAFGM